MSGAVACPGCGRSTADDVCLRCAAEDHFRSASLVRGFVIQPDHEARQPPPAPPRRPAVAAQRRLPGPAVPLRRPVPWAGTAAVGHCRSDHAGRGPRTILSVAIGLGAILLAALIGIVGAVVTAPR